MSLVPEDADLHPALHLLVDHGPHDDVGVAAELLRHGAHDLVHLRQRQVGAADDVHEQAVRLPGKLRGVQQRAELEARDRLGDGVLAAALAQAEEGLAAALLERLPQRGEVEVDEAGLEEHRPDRLHAAADPLVGAGEGVEHGLVVRRPPAGGRRWAGESRRRTPAAAPAAPPRPASAGGRPRS